MQDENAEFETKIAGRVRAIARQREEFIQAQTKLAEFKDEVRCHAVHSGLPLASCIVHSCALLCCALLCPAVPCCALLYPAMPCCALLCPAVSCCAALCPAVFAVHACS